MLIEKTGGSQASRREMKPLTHWAEIYQRLKENALCLDIETTGWNKPISVIGLYRPRSGVPHVIQLIRGHNLTRDNLVRALAEAQLLITFNGIAFDLKRIRAEFPGSISYETPVLDLYRFARRIGIDTNLKILENTFSIDRIDEHSKRRRIAVSLWQQYEEKNDKQALDRLLEYNRQDTINLYPLAEHLVPKACQGDGPAGAERQIPPANHEVFTTLARAR